jgi:sulfofructosephosphate aldolase
MAGAAPGPGGAARAAAAAAVGQGPSGAGTAAAKQPGSAVGVPALCRQGRMTMLALDQRGSLRTMLARGAPESEVTDAQLRTFKAQAAAALAPHASAVLLDWPHGRDAMAALPPGTPLILAADQLRQRPGGPVEDSGFDEDITAELVRELGPVALKLLVIRGFTGGRGHRAEDIERFMGLARQTARVTLLEGIAQPPDGDRFASAAEQGAAVIATAEELTAYQPSVYKAQVPGYLPGRLERVEEFSRRLTEGIAQPWVVLSNGVQAEDFAGAVRRAVAGGASGFLAGRAIWADAARSDDPAEVLGSVSVPRLRALADIARQTP